VPIEILQEEVRLMLTDFMLNKQTLLFKMKENAKKIQRIRHFTIKTLKKAKLQSHQYVPNTLQIIGFVLHHCHCVYVTSPPESVINHCVFHITNCLIDLGFTAPCSFKQTFVIGMLYLMKSGLCVKNVYWLPQIHALQRHLPHENSLEKMFSMSIKLICETENEIKMLLRRRNKLL
jgi:hypothetical protein